jgi:alcohol dehydrogenase class IV
MSVFKRSIHGAGVKVAGVLSRMLPDRIPVTFVGADALGDLCESIASTGARKVLVVTDPGLVELGLAERVTSSLHRAGLACAVFDGVAPDPTTDQVEAGLAAFEAEGADAVLAFGGGSSMDAAKVIAAAATNGRDVGRLEGPLKVKHPTVPLYAVPTTAGTGSEVTIAAVVSDPVTHAKKFFIDPKLLPAMTALDPALMVGLPPAITAATGMDALTHAIESYLSLTSRPQTEAYAETSVRMVFEALPTAYAQGGDLKARKTMALASYYGGLAFGRTSVGYVHAIAHTFGAWYQTPHGLANAIVLPHVLEFSKRPVTARLAKLADIVGVGKGGEAERADAFIDAVRGLEEKLEIPPRLAALRAEDVPAIARQALAEAHLNYPVPRYMSQSQAEEIISGMCPSA